MITVQLLGAKSVPEALSYGYSAPQIISGLLGNLAKNPGKLTGKRDLSPSENTERFPGIFKFWKM
jgi:hypothetical protein